MDNQTASKTKLMASTAAPAGPQNSAPNPGLPSKWDDRASFSVDELPEIFPISRAGAYAAIANGEISSIRIGRRIVIPRAVIERMLAA